MKGVQNDYIHARRIITWFNLKNTLFVGNRVEEKAQGDFIILNLKCYDFFIQSVQFIVTMAPLTSCLATSSSLELLQLLMSS